MRDYSFENSRKYLAEKFGENITETDVMNYAMYPQVTEEFLKFKEKYGDVSVIPTRPFLEPLHDDEAITVHLETGKKIFVTLNAVGKNLDSTGSREVFFELNGIPRSIRVPDNDARKTIVTHEQAVPGVPGSVGAPMLGVIIAINVKEGQIISKGAPLAVISAMKMETVVSAPVAGTVKRIPVKNGDNLTAGTLLVEIV